MFPYAQNINIQPYLKCKFFILSCNWKTFTKQTVPIFYCLCSFLLPLFLQGIFMLISKVFIYNIKFNKMTFMHRIFNWDVYKLWLVHYMYVRLSYLQGNKYQPFMSNQVKFLWWVCFYCVYCVCHRNIPIFKLPFSHY